MERSLQSSACSFPTARPESSHAETAEGRREEGRKGLRARNAHWLQLLVRSGSDSRRLHWRNALVAANLGLVRQVANRWNPKPGLRYSLPFDDLLQIGSLGLIRAIEAFDPRQGSSLSSFAVPYIRGAIAHELRDRGALLRIPRPLWELRQRARALQERRRAQGLAILADEELAAELGCSGEALAEALAVGRFSALLSLDAPLAERGDPDEPTNLLEQIAAADTSPDDGEEEAHPSDPEAAARLRWMRQQLAELDPQLHNLITGRLVDGCTWVELGQQLGVHPRMAQRRCLATLARLREAGRQGFEAHSPANGARNDLSGQGGRGRLPAGRRSESAGH
jgi:RNA polymerase sigma-B factor